jgi:hypothetical protein
MRGITGHQRSWSRRPAIIATGAIGRSGSPEGIAAMTRLTRHFTPAILTIELAACVVGAPRPAAAQLALSAEAQQYADQDPQAVLRAMKTRVSQTTRGTDISACQAIPATGLRGVRNTHDYFLSEVGGCAQLACFLAQVPSTIHDYSMLVVDQTCSGKSAIRDTLVLPDRFTLAGVGINGAGALEFQLPDGAPAIRFHDSTDVTIRMTTIRDLTLAGHCCNNVGIDVSNSQYVYVKNVRLQNFAFGVLGDNAFSVFIDQSSVHDNAFNLVMGDNSTSWRVRDSTASQGLTGIYMAPTARGHVVTGGRVEGNLGPGIRIEGQMNVVENTWFEGNGSLFNTLYGVSVASQAQKTRILSNLFSSQLIGDAGLETRSCFNMSFAGNSADVNQC